MKVITKIFIFGYCRNMLGRLLPHSTKDISFLDCPVCADLGENRKPFRASNSWQSRKLYDSFKNLVIILHSNQDKGACKRCSLIHKIIGSGKSGRHRSGENSDSLFVGAFSLFLLFFFSCCFRFFFSSLSLLCA